MTEGGISAPFIRYPIGTSLLMAGILFVGLVAYPLLPVAPLPQVDFPTIQITANLPGGSPETMASSVAQPLERQFAQIPGIAQMTSTSYLGTASITIQFDLNRSIDGAANDVQGAINAASGQLPKNLPSPPTYRKVNPADSPILLLSATSDTLPLTTVSDSIDAQLAQQISQISGVAQVFIGGQQKPSVRVQIDPAKLVAKGLSLEDVRSAIAITTVDSPKGNIDGDKRAYTIYANDQLLQSKDWNDVIIAYRNGGPLRIKDIGQAVTGPEDAKQAAWANGKRGVFLVVFKQPGANVIETVDRIKATLPRLVAAIPPAVKIEVISDRTTTIRAAVEDVQFTLLLTIALVVMVIFVFLRSFWATVIPAITVPLALLGACALMWVFGYSLDNLSLMALTIAVGFVVDDAIVMLENITRYIEEGERPLAAAYQRLQGNRLHHRVDLYLAGCGADPAALDGRHHRTPVPRIRGRAGDDHLRLDVRVADPDPNDGLALPARPWRGHPRQVLPVERERLRRDAAWLRKCARPRAQLAPHHAGDLLRHARFVDLSLHPDPEGLLPAAGRRPDHRDLGSLAGHLVRRDATSSGRPWPNRDRRSRRRFGSDEHRRQRPRRQ
ncbi:multidrug efflux pump subunit AcrB [Bradyrhizobium sp. GM24.11]